LVRDIGWNVPDGRHEEIGLSGLISVGTKPIETPPDAEVLFLDVGERGHWWLI